MSVKGGRFALDLSTLLEAVGPALRRGGMALQAGIMESSPVRKGDLRRSWTTSEAELAGESVTVRVGSNKVYARYQNTRTRNAGYVQAGIEAQKESARQEIRDGIAGAKEKLWIRES